MGDIDQFSKCWGGWYRGILDLLEELPLFPDLKAFFRKSLQHIEKISQPKKVKITVFISSYESTYDHFWARVILIQKQLKKRKLLSCDEEWTQTIIEVET